MKTKILLVKPDHLGDFAVTLPAIWELTQRFGRENITIFVTRPNGQWGTLLPWLPRIVEVEHSRYDRPMRPVVHPDRAPHTPSWPQSPHPKAASSGFFTALSLLPQGITHGIELTSSRHDPWGKLWLFAAGAGWRSGLQGKWDFLLHAKHGLGEGHQKNRMAHRFPPEWGITGETDPALFMPAPFHRSSNAPSGEIVLAPFAGQPAKEWPLAKWRELILALRPAVGKRAVAILAGPDRSGNGLDLVRSAGLDEHFLFVPNSIGETLERLARAAAVVTLDTAVAHYAWLAGAPTCQVFAGTTDPARWASAAALKTGTVVTLDPPPPCAPCRLPVCNQNGHICLERIDSGRVFRALAKLTPLIPG